MTMIFKVGDRVDVVDLRDNAIVERDTAIISLYEDAPPGTTEPATYALLACGFSVSTRCLSKVTPMGRILWQGKSEQKWRLGQLVPPASRDGPWTQQFDFVWLADDDPRSLSSCDHTNKLSLYGSQEELARLGPILVATLNASRTANHLHHVSAGSR